MVGHSAQSLHALRAHPDPLGPQGRTDAGIFECVNTLTVLLPRIIAETPRRPCEAMTIKSQRFAPRGRDYFRRRIAALVFRRQIAIPRTVRDECVA
jgi:hypothetical protein